jgi:hypothetical protein
MERFESFADGSGAEGVVSAGRFRFAANFVAGSVRIIELGNYNWMRRSGAYKAAIAVARREMAAAVAGLGPEWMAAHRAMYELDGGAS